MTNADKEPSWIVRGREYTCMETEDEDPGMCMALFRSWIDQALPKIEQLQAENASLQEKLQTARQWDDIESARNEQLQAENVALQAKCDSMEHQTEFMNRWCERVKNKECSEREFVSVVSHYPIQESTSE